MFKKPIWKHIAFGLIWAVCLGGLFVLMSFIGIKRASMLCREVKVYIPGNEYFVDRQEVNSILHVGNNTLVGKKLEDINIHQLEKTLQANPFIEFAKVYADMDGVVNVEIRQRQPILRIMNRFEQDFYVDQYGLKIPLSANFTAPVLVATGNIDEVFINRVDTLHTAMAKALFKTADFIRRDSLWDAQIEQINVNANHEIELIPRIGNQRILLGNADSLDKKFKNLLIFYQKAIPKTGWGAYKVINIKYANQVIGIKSDSLLKTVALKPKQIVKQDTNHINQHSTQNIH
ncbi:cell division protein FtsQ/DivIB [Mucilaginibacter arboris]|uniref:Cell division protein FtsQ n=1 Tax=Mucilaginibacter arboris TaxID=2682090 RepID=A0A7K1STU2_9SPHI|nr:cell division protein FtsQ [Mucilaginibacter arboris]MVN20741.1 cell division protein FtsQ [Mucilaginibacter arboris]